MANNQAPLNSACWRLAQGYMLKAICSRLYAQGYIAALGFIHFF